MMNSLVKIMVLCGLLVALTGCFEQKMTYTINPDGSGKAAIVYITPLAALDSKIMQMGDDAKPSLKEQLRMAVEKLITKSSGVDAWKDVTYKFTKDGKVYFKGTAYFANFNKFKFNKSKKSKGKSANIPQLKIGKNSMKLFVSKQKKEKKSSAKQSLLQDKIDYQNGKAMLRMFLYDMKIENKYIFPGKIGKFAGVKKSNANSVTFNVDGKKMLNMIDKMATNDKYNKDDFNMSQDSDIFDMLPNMTIDAEVKGPMKPLFNYKKEVAAAKRKWQKTKKRIFTKAVSAPPSATKIAPVTKTVKADKNPKVVSVKYSIQGTEQEKKDFFLYQSGLELSILQPLPSKATAITKAVVTKAEMTDGESILGEREWDRKISFPKLAKDGKSVLLGVKLQLPKKTNAGIKVLEGTIEYLSGSGEKIVDLGLIPLKKGAKGKKLGALIVKAGKGKEASNMLSKDQSGFTLKLGVNKDSVISIEFYDKSGKKLPFKPSGTSWTDTTATYYFKTKKELPKEVRIKAKVYKNAAAKKMNFSLKNIDLFGNQLKK